MLAAIQFHSKLQRRTIEIQNEAAGRMLTPKIHSELSVTQLLPKPHFNFG